MEYYQFLFKSLSQNKKDILVALLADVGFTGFEEEESKLKACVSSVAFDEYLFNKIIQTTNTKYSKSVIKEINWNEQWEAEFEPVLIFYPQTQNCFAVVRASFHKPASEDCHDIIVTPKMSFGTGHHATTYLMIERMSLHSFQNKSVIDFGTGTGVLAILAEKMGAAKIDAIDNDEWSINNAKDNIEENDCHKIKLHNADTITLNAKADIILANINLNVIISTLDEITNACKDCSSLLFSGILIQDKDLILDALTKKNIKIINCFEKNNWLAIEAKYKKL